MVCPMHDGSIGKESSCKLTVASQENKLLFRVLFEHSQDAILMTTPEGSIQEANPAAIELFGFARQALCSLRCPDIFDVYDPSLAAALKERQEIGSAKRAELTAINKSGEKFPVEVYSVIAPVQPVRSFVIIRDISERKRAETLLQKSEEQKRLALEAARLGTWEHNTETRENYWDERTREIFGVAKDEVIDMAKFMSLVHPDDKNLIGEKVKDLLNPLKGKEHFETEYRILPPNGEVRWVIANGKRQTEAKGPERRVTRVVGTNMDVTERKRVAEELRELNETLEQQVAERTELARHRAKQLQALAIELIESEEKERRRLATLLHDDLQQILAAARFQLEALPKMPELAMVAQLLDSAIHKSRGLSYDLSPPVLIQGGLSNSLKWLAGRMREQFALQVEMKECDDDEVDPSVKRFIFRAVQELLFNVKKHAGVDKAQIAVRRSQGNLLIIVSDKGMGVGEVDLNRLPNKAGFGLLTIKERANFIGGDLTISKGPGRGSKFIVSIPIR